MGCGVVDVCVILMKMVFGDDSSYDFTAFIILVSNIEELDLTLGQIEVFRHLQSSLYFEDPVRCANTTAFSLQSFQIDLT